ncbi:tRNA (adenosine(37)-N6)-threonylcarbamoyltransferase complex dimerization subunit type 1 TsaB [Oxalobacter vibrioformis]|uniref:tRNA (Adenosine(37)-N6)-threonylcarbamoyltransferase complex dimerization subunit type 1 TsaB n=1 Tax=Oxalobacter vibrioformis TaxID=933080 RepID=A0A9E9LV61_9BURK|nr:tRNA (adenosine(37)-N6)-threonylcarbamoyltransferase complex dimerization subunit type 1 TsaB [Oxalobacter vibrioformis]NLC24666.1 tRNA (adenosine(37)-N6)-threonylcarbamoyltransferase complex dimerization subunit type 1 TsaB [Oxalobacter sp.]WAW10280.1 tRNA (adenosine(37)-N6)-threonylcarbamoyltransferase complex dimerization subunit type 1 TsaB [Oxalobacter vibrioformis]
MPTIIAFETSSDTASVSLMKADGSIQTCASQGVTTHSQTILPMIQALLADAKLAVADCDAIAFGCGPGSFTGVRTACGVAQGLAFGAALPLIPVVSLMAMAEACRIDHRATDVLAILDARMKEVYWAQYRHDENGSWQTVIAPRITPPEAVMPEGRPDACGNGLIAYADALDLLPVAVRHTDIIPGSTAVAILGKAAYQRGETISAHDASPLYLRNKVAYTTEERRIMKEGVGAC